MAKTKEISLFLGKKLSDGDFGSMDFSVGEVTTIEDGDVYKDEVFALIKRVKRRAGIANEEIQTAINAKIAAKKAKGN
jgi:hypothetical protein